MVLCAVFTQKTPWSGEWEIRSDSVAYNQGQLFREGLFQFVTSFSLPMYAIVGAQAAEKARLPVLGVIVIGVIAPTAGRWYVDVSSAVPPKQFVRGEWFVSIAALTALVWVICDAAGLSVWGSFVVPFVIGYTVRVAALYRGGRSPWPRNQRGSTSTTTAVRYSGARSPRSLRASCAISVSRLTGRQRDEPSSHRSNE
jgi:hypothetical protein